MTDDPSDLIEQLQRGKRWRMVAILAFSTLFLISLIQTILIVTVRDDLNNTQEAVRLGQEAARLAQETATGARDAAVDAQNLASATFPTINDQRVYLSYRSDKAAPKEKPGYMQFEYETIYVLPVDRPPDSGTTFGATAMQISPIGKCRHSAWTRAGDKLAYCNFSRSGLGRGAVNQIAFYHVHTGKTSFLTTRVSSMGGVSWDEKGEAIAYVNWGPDQVCSYNLKNAKETVHYNVEGGHALSTPHVSLSPNGKWICFMARESNKGPDGWLLNLLEVSTSKLTKVGKTDDGFGVYGPFYWSRDSNYIVLFGFQLDQDGKRTSSFYKYTLSEEQMTDYRANFEDIYIQQYRFWIKPEWVEGRFPKR